ncbi:MAG: DUF11 domain-containing protein, partial [Candidatus Viridilinea halotolerans]
MLTSIAFAEDGSMLLGLRSRTGDMGTTPMLGSDVVHSEGDLLRAAPDGSGGWTTPNSVNDHFNDSSGFVYAGNPSQAEYIEGAQGGVATVPGSSTGTFGGEAITTMAWPLNANYTGGAFWYDQRTGGNATAREQTYNGDQHFKSAGLGDVELLCNWRAIGSRVWHDTNGNGIQDPGEPDMTWNDLNGNGVQDPGEGVRLQLLDASGVPTGAEVVTAAQVNPDTPQGDNWRFYVSPHEQYQVRIHPDMFLPGQPLFGFTPTQRNVGGDTRRDSDADANGIIAVPVGLRSQIDLRYAFGLVEGDPEPWIDKTAPATVASGQQFAYTITYGNRGRRAAPGVTIVDTLPTGLTFVSATGSPSVSGQTITWNIGNLPVDVPGDPPRTLTLMVRATGNEADFPITTAPERATTWDRVNVVIISTTIPTIPPVISTGTPTQIQRPNFLISKSGPATAGAGEYFDYTITVRNNGVIAANGVQMEDTLPTGLTYHAATGGHSVSGQRVLWDIGTLNAGEQHTYNLRVRAAAVFPNDAIINWNRTNIVEIRTTTPGAGSKWGSSTTILQRPRLTITLTSPSPV